MHLLRNPDATALNDVQRNGKGSRRKLDEVFTDQQIAVAVGTYGSFIMNNEAEAIFERAQSQQYPHGHNGELARLCCVDDSRGFTMRPLIAATGLLAYALVCAQVPAQAASDPAYSAKNSAEARKKPICKRTPVTGSRLGSKLVCKSTEEWAAYHLAERQALEYGRSARGQCQPGNDCQSTNIYGERSISSITPTHSPN